MHVNWPIYFCVLQSVKKLENERTELCKVVEFWEERRDTCQNSLKSHELVCRLRDTDSPEDIKPFLSQDEFNQHLILESEKSITLPTSEHSRIFTSMGVHQMEESKMMEDLSASKQRPNYLPVSEAFSMRSSRSINDAGITLTTPSNEFLESLMEGGTGLTPTPTSSPYVPSCSIQLRSANNIVDLSSPDSMPSKLVSLWPDLRLR